MTGEAMATSCEVELDIFSGMPNPVWSLTNAATDNFLKRLAALPLTSARELSGNLGYRGFIVQCMQGDNKRLIRVQNGIVHISEDETNVYAYDNNRELEHWVLNTGRPHLKDEIYQIAEREFR
jgi:hypothetical protein